MKFIGYDNGNKVLAEAPTSSGGSALAVNTYAAARSLTSTQLSGQTTVLVRGRGAANDGAGGFFSVVAGTGTDDDATILLAATNTIRLVRIYDGIASAAWWGVLPSSNDVGPALQAAQDWADAFSQKRSIFIPAGFYYIRTPVTLKVPTEGVRPEGSSDGNHGTVFQWVSPSTWPSTVNGKLCDLFEPVFQTEFNNSTTLRNISLYGDYGGGGSNKDTYLDGAMFPSLKFFKIPTNGMTGIEIARGVEIINCKCQGFLIGMQNRDASHTRINNCTLDGNYVGMWYWSNRGDHAIKDTGLTSHIAGSCAGGEGWTVQMDANHLGFGTYGLLQIGTPRLDSLRDTRSRWRHWYNNSYVVKKASRFNVGTLSGAYGEFQLGDTVGLFNQDTPSQNGIWIVNSGAWTRDPSFVPVEGAVVVVRFSGSVNVRETVWQVTTANPVIGQPITFTENPAGGVWECLWRNTRHEACGEAAIYTFANSTTGNCKFEFTGAGFDTQIGAQIFNLSPAMIAAMGSQTQEYLFRFGVIGSTFIFEQDNFTNSGISPQSGAARLGNYIHELNLPANVHLDLRGLGKITFGKITNQRSPGALLTQVRQSGDNATSLNPYQDMSPAYNPGKLQLGGLYDLLNPAAWNAGGNTVLSLVDAATVDPYPVDMAIALPGNAKAIYFDKATNSWAWGWRQTVTFPTMGTRYAYFWAWVKGRVSLKIRPRNGSGQIIEYRGDTRSEISGWQPLQLGNMDFTGATHIEFRIDSENSSSFWIAGCVFSWDDYAPYSETTRPATRDGFQFLNGDFASTIDTATLTANRTVVYPNKSGTVAFLDDVGSGGGGGGATDAELRDRATHTGTQTASTISNFAEAVDDEVATLLQQGTGISLTYNDAANTLTISSTAQPADADLTAVANLSTNGLIERTGAGTAATQAITATGRALVNAADQAAARTAIALGTSDSPTFAGATINGNLRNALLSLQDLFGGSVSIDILSERLWGAANKYTITRSNVATIAGGGFLAGGQFGAAETVAAGATGTITIDFNPFAGYTSNATGGFRNSGGVLIFANATANTNTTFQLEGLALVSGTDTWVQLIAPTAINGIAGWRFVVPNTLNHLKAIRMTFVNGGAAGLQLAHFAYFPNPVRQDFADRPTYLPLGLGGDVFGPIVVRNGDNTLQTTIGRGFIRVGASAGQLSGTEAINTTLSSPGTGWSFAWARAQVGDMIQIIPRDGSSNAITGRCAVAGTVLADTSAWSAGLLIQLRILRTAP